MEVNLKKAAIQTSDLASGGLLNRGQFNTFVNLVRNYSRILDIVRIVPVDNTSGQIDKLDLASPVTRKATEATAYTSTQTPTFAKVNYDCVKLACAYDLSTESEEDNIERKNFRNTVMQAFAERIGIDQSDLLVNGDESLGGTDASSMLRKANDGLSVKSILCPNYLDANGLGISLKLLKDGLNKMPVRYKGGLRKSLRWIIASNPYEDFVYEYGNRATSGGDSVYSSAPDLRPFGIPFEECPVVPVDQTIGTAATDGTFITLTDPRNLVWVVRRKVTMHTEFQPRSDITEMTIYLRVDFVIEDLNAMVKIKGVSADVSSAYAG